MTEDAEDTEDRWERTASRLRHRTRGEADPLPDNHLAHLTFVDNRSPLGTTMSSPACSSIVA
jgi:hypothetical protein